MTVQLKNPHKIPSNSCTIGTINVNKWFAATLLVKVRNTLMNILLHSQLRAQGQTPLKTPTSSPKPASLSFWTRILRSLCFTIRLTECSAARYNVNVKQPRACNRLTRKHKLQIWLDNGHSSVSLCVSYQHTNACSTIVTALVDNPAVLIFSAIKTNANVRGYR